MKDIMKHFTASNVLIVVSGIILLVSLLQKNSSFMDCRRVFKRHFSVFKDSPLQGFVIFGVPFLLAVAVVFIQPVDGDVIDNLNIVVSILMSMLFAILTILCTFSVTEINSPKDKKVDSIHSKTVRYNELLGETFNSVMFECILCVFLLVIAFLERFCGRFESGAGLNIISGVIYYLVFTVVLNIFVIIKRVMILYQEREK